MFINLQVDLVTSPLQMVCRISCLRSKESVKFKNFKNFSFLTILAIVGFMSIGRNTSLFKMQRWLFVLSYTNMDAVVQGRKYKLACTKLLLLIIFFGF